MPPTYRPGPGSYDPEVPENESYKFHVIPSLPRPPNFDKDDKDAWDKYHKAMRNREEHARLRDMHPDVGDYDIPSTFQTPRQGRNAREILNGTPRSPRSIFNIDLLDRTKVPGPGTYDLQKYGLGTRRDRTYRKKLPLERINYMCPSLPPISPRRVVEDEPQAREVSLFDTM
jgi:hypothetical protein